MGPSLKQVQVLLDGIPCLQCGDCTTERDVFSKPAEDSLHPAVLVTNKDVEHFWLQSWPRHATCHWSPCGQWAVDHNSGYHGPCLLSKPWEAEAQMCPLQLPWWEPVTHGALESRRAEQWELTTVISSLQGGAHAKRATCVSWPHVMPASSFHVSGTHDLSRRGLRWSDFLYMY